MPNAGDRQDRGGDQAEREAGAEAEARAPVRREARSSCGPRRRRRRRRRWRSPTACRTARAPPRRGQPSASRCVPAHGRLRLAAAAAAASPASPVRCRRRSPGLRRRPRPAGSRSRGPSAGGPACSDRARPSGAGAASSPTRSSGRRPRCPPSRAPAASRCVTVWPRFAASAYSSRDSVGRQRHGVAGDDRPPGGGARAPGSGPISSRWRGTRSPSRRRTRVMRARSSG